MEGWGLRAADGPVARTPSSRSRSTSAALIVATGTRPTGSQRLGRRGPNQAARRPSAVALPSMRLAKVGDATGSECSENTSGIPEDAARRMLRLTTADAHPRARPGGPLPPESEHRKRPNSRVNVRLDPNAERRSGCPRLACPGWRAALKSPGSPACGGPCSWSAHSGPNTRKSRSRLTRRGPTDHASPRLIDAERRPVDRPGTMPRNRHQMPGAEMPLRRATDHLLDAGVLSSALAIGDYCRCRGDQSLMAFSSAWARSACPA
jgi:hypothetical protein